MRIADNMTYDQVQTNLGKNRTEMADLQNKAATQKRVTKPSDDPVAAARVLSERVDLQGNKQFLKNLNYAKSFLELTDQSLDQVTQNLVRVKELALAQANDASGNEESRRVTAAEVEQIYNQIVQVGNRKLGERYIFGGYKTTTRPFDINGQYKGDKGEMMVQTDKDSFIAMNVPGNAIFLGQGLGADGIYDSNSVQATTIEDFVAEKQERKEAKELKQNQIQQDASLREPAMQEPLASDIQPTERGVNVFGVLKRLQVALKADDKEGIQESLDEIDESISQVVLSRAAIGSRSMALQNVFDGLQKAKVDNQASISQLEDADVFKVISDINQTESTLKATLATSSKLIQPSLLDFLR